MSTRQLNVKAFALTGGILWGLGVFIMTWWVMMFTGNTGDPTIIGKMYYIGYSISPIGSVIGAVYGFFDVGIFCAIFALLYNKIAGK